MRPRKFVRAGLRLVRLEGLQFAQSALIQELAREGLLPTKPKSGATKATQTTVKTANILTNDGCKCHAIVVVDVLLGCLVAHLKFWMAPGGRKACGPSTGKDLQDDGCMSR